MTDRPCPASLCWCRQKIVDNLEFRGSMMIMNGEQKANNVEAAELTVTSPVRTPWRDLPGDEYKQKIEELHKELEAEPDGGPEFEFVPSTRESLETLTSEQLEEQVDLLKERIDLARQQKELDYRALKLGLLKLADRAPRCSHLKSNGEPCRAPAIAGKLFCVFHGRALEVLNGPGINVKVLEDRESLQITVKQIMEQIVSGRLEPQTASLLLRAVQIANSALKSSQVHATRGKRKQTQRETRDAWGNPEENSA